MEDNATAPAAEVAEITETAPVATATEATETVPAAEATETAASAAEAPTAAEAAAPEEISYHVVEKENAVSAIWEMQGRKHLRTIDPHSSEGKQIMEHYTVEH
jgi:hypothetical protein